jgi:hypothetical protein
MGYNSIAGRVKVMFRLLDIPYEFEATKYISSEILNTVHPINTMTLQQHWLDGASYTFAKCDTMTFQRIKVKA